MIKDFQGKSPQLEEQVFVAASALVLGNVSIGFGASIWYGSVVRGDVNSITIGAGTNIQDLCMVHVTGEKYPTSIGEQVTVGHRAVIHGCSVGDRCLVGIGAVLLDGVEVGEESVVAAGSLLPPGKVYPPRSLILGSPARVKAQISDEEVAWILDSARRYEALAREHAEEA